jgi:diamine N-acetyltransferase
MIFEVKNQNQIETVELLAKEIWVEHYTPIIGEKQVDYMLDKFQSKEAIANQISREGFIYYLIQKNGQFIGYIGVQPKRKELFLSKIYIKNLERGKGYAKEAMQFLENLTKEKNLNKITLTVNKNNLNSIKAYRKFGFKNIGSIFQNIGNGFVMDDYKMEKNLTDKDR